MFRAWRQGGEGGVGKDYPWPCPPCPSRERPAPVWKQIRERPGVRRGRDEPAFPRCLPGLSPQTSLPPHTSRPSTTAALGQSSLIKSTSPSHQLSCCRKACSQAWPGRKAARHQHVPEGRRVVPRARGMARGRPSWAPLGIRHRRGFCLQRPQISGLLERLETGRMGSWHVVSAVRPVTSHLET